MNHFDLSSYAALDRLREALGGASLGDEVALAAQLRGRLIPTAGRPGALAELALTDEVSRSTSSTILGALVREVLAQLGPADVDAAWHLGPAFWSGPGEPMATLRAAAPGRFEAPPPMTPSPAAGPLDPLYTHLHGVESGDRAAALAALDWTLRGPMRAELVRAAQVFEEGLDDEAAVAWAQGALTLRLALEERAADLDPDLLLGLRALDQALAGVGPAMLLLSGPDRAELIGGRPLDPDLWWGRQAPPLRSTVPQPRLLAQGAEPTVLHAEGPAEEVLAQARLVLVRGGEGLRARIDLLKPRGGARRVGQVQWMSGRLSLGARSAEAIVRAFRAASALLPHGLPCCALDEVGIRMDCAEGGTVDGPSLGLPLALAFLSLWSGRPLPEDLFATGELSERGEVLPVEGMGAKRSALRRGQTLLCPPGNAGEGLRAVATLREAAESVGLLPLPRQDTSKLSRAKVEELLKAVVRDATCQRYSQAASAGQVHPATVLGESILYMVGQLAQTGTLSPQRATDLLSSLSVAQVTFSHAADHDGRLRAEQMAQALRGRIGGIALQNDDVLRADLDRLWAAIDDLDGTAEARSTVERLTERVQRLLGQTPAPDLHRWVTLCTVGRATLHLRAFTQASATLREALDVAEEQDRARTGIYLAMALREAGELDAADKALRGVSADLTAHTQPFDAEYAQQTQTYWAYERARLALAQGRPRESITWARAALALKPHDWPKLGILRTLAWAWRAGQNVGESRAVAAEARATLDGSSTGGAYRVILERVVQEAAGPLVVGGEVY